MSGELAALGRFGPFSALEEVPTTPPGWHPVTALVDDRDLLAHRIGAVSEALSGPGSELTPPRVRRRVAVSITQLGLIARLAAVALAATVDDVELPDPAAFVFADQLGGPYPLAVLVGPRPGPSRWPDTLFGLVGPGTEVMINAYGLSPRIGWGNVASALAGAVRMVAKTEPKLGTWARASALEALGRGELRRAGAFDEHHQFRRRSCCLIYRLAPQPVYCGDCVLARSRVGS